MIINVLTAENFRKYKRLEIRDIPAKGLITVSGSNESGKTSIADALSFALFGRTYFTDESNAEKLIYWGAKDAVVVLTFTEGDRTYQLTRIINKDGSVDAQLFDEREADLVADTPEETEIQLKKILGYGYETFSDSFYLVQRELSTPHPNSESIKDMVGISEYSRVSNAFHRDSERDNEALAMLRPQYEETYHELKELDIDDAWLPELAEARDTFETSKDAANRLSHTLRNSAESYRSDSLNFQGIQRKHGMVKLVSDILLALLIGGLIAWGALLLFPEQVSKIATDGALLDYENFSAWSEKWMLLLAAVLGLLFFLGLLWSWRIDDRELSPLQNKSELLADAFGDGHRLVSTSLKDVIPARCVTALEQSGHDLSAEQEMPELAGALSLADSVKGFVAPSEEVEQSAKGLRSRLKDQARHVEHHNVVINREIDIEMQRTAEAAKLRKTLEEFDRQIREHTNNIKVQTAGIEMLRRAAREFTERFNQSVSKTAARILPHFTNNHYRNVRIDELLNVAVFSEEKNDFMDFDEISSGTQRQIMLALRIAMSEELAKNNDNDKQFIILDEPFAFFDHQRTVATLKQLPQVSDIISQVWVASQEFPEDTNADKSINCIQGQDEFSA